VTELCEYSVDTESYTREIIGEVLGGQDDALEG